MVKGQMLWSAMLMGILCLVVVGQSAGSNQVSGKELIEVKGTVRDINGVAVSNAAVFIKESILGTVTNVKGYFEIAAVPENSVMLISHPDFEPVEMQARKSGKEYEIVLKGKPGWVSRAAKAEVTAKKPVDNHENSGSGLALERWPRFPGGTKELVKFLAHHMRYPAEAVAAGVEGQASVSFFWTKKGTSAARLS
ncbi:carboxypeptidase-like regulatory domain-containing protein [Dyadobacter sp. CY327]|uniref:carboxypeptidase-like regulatory domain-containing protein n=1 Tax=Dyadobacter sp. CY327 TaxID=2907301 RepID=UPI001F15F83B|nr:carboxypeptidase-like regulatory domain-containing protein [Dyadobacter sp. CY327]MCE7072876.1 carboxypeptidase-like regulatory domain-containing protein [Dyadobacter sp. CY327]